MKIAIVHPWLKFGGSEARALWSVHALKNTCGVTLITSGGADIDRLNAYYGTNLIADEFVILEGGVSNWLKKLSVGDALRGAVFNRWLRKNTEDYDLVISTYNLIDVPVPTIQFIADFSWDDAERRRLHPEQGWRGFLHGDNVFRRLYLVGVKWLSGARSAAQVLQNSACIISNSRFSADILKASYKVDSQVIYPPVVGNFPQVSWEKKKNRFVVLGRISPEKELEKVIQIIEGVREKGHSVHLHILGDWQNSAYGRMLYEQEQEKASWLHFEGDVRGKKKVRLLAESRYAVHGCTGEAFGIAIAEILKAGCVAFVPNEGGPLEIVDDKRLTYSEAIDAVNKIDTVLKDPTQQKELSSKMIYQGDQFSEKKFIEAVQRLVYKCAW